MHSDSQTVCGVWVASRPFLRLELDVDPASLTAAVEQALAASITGIEHPTDWDKVEYPLPALAGVDTWAQFMKGAHSVTIAKTEGAIRLVSHQNRGPREGFVSLDPPLEIPASSDAKAFADSLAIAFARCR